MKRVMILLFALGSLLLSGMVQAEGSVARAIVTTGVAEHEPVNDLERVLAGNEKVLFFTELRDMQGQTVKHRWSHGGEVLAEVEFKVGGPRWRVWSSKTMMPEWAGAWSVAVVDGEGNVLSEKSFEFTGNGEVEKSPTADEPAVENGMEEPPAEAPSATEGTGE